MNLIKTGIILVFAGVVLVMIGTALTSHRAGVGGLIMIGPVPVAFGTSPEVTLIAMILGIVLMIMMFFMGQRNG